MDGKIEIGQQVEGFAFKVDGAKAIVAAGRAGDTFVLARYESTGEYFRVHHTSRFFAWPQETCPFCGQGVDVSE